MFIRKRRVQGLMKKNRFILKSLLIALIILLLFALDFRLYVRTYEIDSEKISLPLRIALVTDLHSCRYGNEQTRLIDAVDRQKPDIILLGGDIFDDVIDDSYTEQFLRGIADRYPCFYVTGNHEYWSGPGHFADKMKILQKYSVPVLSGTCQPVNIRGESILICGLDDPDFHTIHSDISREEAQEMFLGQLDDVGSKAANNTFTILLSHRPEYYADYMKYDFDLVLCGHAHGGQWRIPGILNGLYAPDQGLFPAYAGGRYEQDGKCMIVSRGLSRESTLIPRIFNRPELVVVNIT